MYLDANEAWYKRMIEDRVNREGILCLEYEISNGNRCNIYTIDNKAILMGLTIEQAYWVVNGIYNFWDRKKGE